ncbi:MAG: hypothetical protein JXA41_03010, partial [Deltaproteobacteria bacterium]|nr:hypothetical protein [Deltaproteobacteria bacterium]
MKKRILKYSGTAIGQLLFLTFFLFTLGITPVAADTAVWNGGTGNWDDTGNWSGGVVPNGADDDVLIDDGKATDSVVNLNMTATIGNLTIDENDTLNINNTRALYVTGGKTIANDGTLHINATTTSGASLLLSGDVTLTGTGTVSTSNHLYNKLYGTTGTEILTNDTGHTIQGSGRLGNNALLLVNKGLIAANQSNALTINLTGVRDDLNGTNSGTLRAEGGTLSIDDSGIANTGTLEARDGSQLVLKSTRINGGTLTTDGSGVIQLQNTAVISNVTNAAVVNVANSETGYVEGTIINNNTIQLNATTSSGARLLLSGDVILTGTGTVSMSDHYYNYLCATGSEVLTNDTGHTIQGSGHLGYNNMLLVNKGLIEADQSTALTVNLTGGRDDLNGTNSGTLRADGGTLSIDDSGFTNTGTL